MNHKDLQLHVAFGRSAGASLQQALGLAGREGRVVAPYDDFSFGPIHFDDPDVRGQGVEKLFGFSDWRQVYEGSLPVVAASRAADKPPIAWVSPDSTYSLAGFLWWLSHMGTNDFLVQDISRLALLTPNELAEHLDCETQISPARRAHDLSLWQRLKVENAPLRVLSEGGLVSAPIDIFDAVLLKHANSNWCKMAKIVGETLGQFYQDGLFQTGDLVLAARLRTLAESGLLQWQGDLYDMRQCELRLPR